MRYLFAYVLLNCNVTASVDLVSAPSLNGITVVHLDFDFYCLK